ncbi:hypothetical protein B0T24DRAFT_254122 [Lasiosphaeria ovina]|uniref:CCHC-type domain-containing protein n=1 Tax=Lasiosphaeria ovina TaxID=92902 RepID=A0AAE0N7M0_9PEZI|nr:hypothetical protein B0T24DRAFT_254122 [Lasiosphaeria ovina]
MDGPQAASEQQLTNDATPGEPGLQPAESLAGKKRSASETNDYSGPEGGRASPSLGDCHSLSPKRAKFEISKASSASDELDEGEIRDPSPSSELAATQTVPPEEPRKASKNWNRGISNGLRISFGAAIQDTAGTPSQETVGTPSQESASPSQDKAVPSSSSVSLELVTYYPAWTTEYRTILNGLVLPKSFLGWDKRPKTGDPWEARLEEWCQSLMNLNTDQDALRDWGIVKGAWCAWVEQQNFSKSLKVIAQKASVRGSIDPQKLLEMYLKAQATKPKKQAESGKAINGEGQSKDTSVAKSSEPKTKKSKKGKAAKESAPSKEAASKALPDKKVLTATEVVQDPPRNSEALGKASGFPDLAYMERYFPGLEPGAIFCVMCASHGHLADQCPEMACSFCRKPDHRARKCPTRQRCDKCKQLGHARKQCGESLSLAPGEIECALCGSLDHTEGLCGEVWQSFKPNTDGVLKVNALPIYCYRCGYEGHYGTECRSNPQKSKGTTLQGTWSRANYERYVDSESSEAAIGFNLSSLSLNDDGGRPDFGGKSIVPRRHVVFESDDDDDNETFIRPPVKAPRAPNITINFSGNNNASSDRGGRRPPRQYNGNTGRGMNGLPNPPLPPGPPPSSGRGGRRGGNRGGGPGRRGRGGYRGNN